MAFLLRAALRCGVELNQLLDRIATAV